MKIKNLGMLVMLALTACVGGTASASDKPPFAFGDPSVIVKTVFTPQKDSEHKGVIVEFETGLCDRYKHCFNPSIMYVDSIPGVGFDYVFKMAKRAGRDAVKLSIGGVAFDEAINNGSHNTIHAAAAFEVYAGSSFGLMVTIDRVQTDNPSTMFGIGFHFR